MEPPKAFIALTAREAQGVREHQCLSTKVFEYTPSKKFFVLLPTMDEAFGVALRQYTINAVKSAVDKTTWIVIQFNFTDQQWLSMLLNQNNEVQINRGPGDFYNEWRVSGVLKLEGVNYELMQIEIGPIGDQEWAKRFWNAKRQRPFHDANCDGCPAKKVQVWPGSKRKHYTQTENGGDACADTYCSTCWRRYFAWKLENADVEAQCKGDIIPEEVKP